MNKIKLKNAVGILNFIHIKEMKQKDTLSLGVGRKSFTWELLAVKHVSVWTKVFLALGSYWRDSWGANGNMNPNLMLTRFHTYTYNVPPTKSFQKRNSSVAWRLLSAFFFNYYYFLNGFYTMSRRRGPQRQIERLSVFCINGHWKRECNEPISVKEHVILQKFKHFTARTNGKLRCFWEWSVINMLAFF